MDEQDRYWAQIDSTGTVVNIVVWDGTVYDAETNPSGWLPPDGMTFVEVFPPHYQGADVGGHYDGTTFTPNETPPPPPPPPPVLPIDVEALSQILLDKGVLTPADLTSP